MILEPYTPAKYIEKKKQTQLDFQRLMIFSVKMQEIEKLIE